MRLRPAFAFAWMGMVLTAAWPAWGEPSQVQGSVLRVQIQAEREAIARQKQQDEALCYQRFAVEDCLEQVRRTYRQQESRLRSQEVRLNDARRQEREADRRQILKDSQAESDKQPPAQVQTRVRKPCDTPDCPGGIPQREQQAKQRAQAQQKQLKSHAAQRQHRQAEREQQAAAARDRQARVQADVQARRERRVQEQAKATAQGKKPAAPLPLTPPAGTP